MSVGSGPVDGEQPDFWDRALPWWHAGCYLVLLVFAGVLLLVELTLGARLLALTGVVALGLLYWFFGRHLIGEDDTWRALAYVTVFALVTLAEASLSSVGLLLLFVLFAHIWTMLPVRIAAGTSVVVECAVVVLAGARSQWAPEALASSVLAGIFTIMLGLLFSLWVRGILAESAERRGLIARLEETRGELADANRRAGALAERERLAADIHDTVAQDLTSIVMLVRSCEALVDDDPVRARERLVRLERTARDGLSEARSLVAQLSVDDRRHPLANALHRLVERTGQEAGVEARLTVTGEPRALPANSEVVLLRAAQEALANVRKHAGAAGVEVRLNYATNGAALEIDDDGRGLAADHADGFGLRGMRRRVEEVGGALTIESAPGSGTNLQVEIP